MRFLYKAWQELPGGANTPPFERLLDLFQQLLLIASGDVAQALRWLTQLDKEYNITGNDDPYSIGEFIQDLEDRGFIKYDDQQNQMVMTAKSERSLRTRSLEEIFKNLRKGELGSHKIAGSGKGQEPEPETRPWFFGDDVHRIDAPNSLLNALQHSSIDNFFIKEDDLVVYDTDHYSSVATVLMIDLSHSMILYGEDRITPAKKVALALSELIMNQYEKDSLDVIAFGNTAWQVSIRDLPYLQVGPYHTNTLAGLELARSILQRKKYANKQIFMITDGKPSAMMENGKLYKNSFGLDRKIVNKVLQESVKCRREKISITTFMIASDPYLQGFVRELTEANHGRAYYASLDALGGYIFEDYIRNRRKTVR
jgi:uncharacterized protein with von Willebrand factor type A (vWA) domain